MRKMKLDTEMLAVESFATSPGEVAAAGTVHGRQDAVDVPRTPGRLGTCLPGYCTCDGQTTCDYSGCIACPNPQPAPALGEGIHVPII